MVLSRFNFKEVQRRELDAPYHFLAKDIDARPHWEVHIEIYDRDGTYLGFIKYVFSTNYKVGEIEMIHSEKPGIGIGRELIEYAEYDMSRRGVKKVGLVASGAMEMGGVEGFWLKLDYKPAPEIPPAWAFMIKKI